LFITLFIRRGQAALAGSSLRIARGARNEEPIGH
jgi:hypothetical protein